MFLETCDLCLIRGLNWLLLILHFPFLLALCMHYYYFCSTISPLSTLIPYQYCLCSLVTNLCSNLFLYCLKLIMSKSCRGIFLVCLGVPFFLPLFSDLHLWFLVPIKSLLCWLIYPSFLWFFSHSINHFFFCSSCTFLDSVIYVYIVISVIIILS